MRNSKAPPAARGWLVETSALVAILLEEADWQAFAEVMATNVSKTCAFDIFEASLAVASRKTLAVSEAYARTTALVEEFAVEILPFTFEMLPHAVAARERYGRGRDGLNRGDCPSYAAAKHEGLTLLYKGDDFARTDGSG